MSLLIKILALQLLVMLSSGAACPVTQTGPTTCVPGCAICNNGACGSCCPKYYALANDCIACSDARCLTCTNSGTETCIECASGYAPKVTSPITCDLLSANSDYNCRSVNGCSATNTCVNGNAYSLNALNQCQTCDKSYRNCRSCNNTVCFGCVTGYALNVSAGSKFAVMKIRSACLATCRCARPATMGQPAALAQLATT